ncbi:polysaccharide deacetylase family protein [Neptuniibacter halophilus]|uniref:polysaccharide deacetylase family protein n=1 Tax=Neptuniibacter halophilus TaxID=651666 RepID=UPI002572AAEA|nr:polysaccharide deacetylase family protein [Neptuniibacter halophilus]
MADWKQLVKELEQWQRPLTLWWRDDDVSRDTPALRQLLQLADQYQVPVHLATIPQLTEDSLITLIDTTRAPCYILQHGICHQNNAREGQRKIELGGQLTATAALSALAEGRHQLQQQFACRYLDILVPPWNRIDPELLSSLSALGYQRLSVLGPRAPQAEPAELNVHLDIIDWKQRRFAGEARLLQQIIDNLQARRRGELDPDEPYGLMTHHLDHDAECWAFLSRLFACLKPFSHLNWAGGPALLEAK